MHPKVRNHSNDSSLSGESEPDSHSRVYAPSDPQELCVVCGAQASGKHFGAYACEACKLFFLRLTQGKNARPLKCNRDERCNIQTRVRSVCRLCRYKKCVESGMSKHKIVYGRNARNSQKFSSPRKHRTISVPPVQIYPDDNFTYGSCISDLNGSVLLPSTPPANSTHTPVTMSTNDGCPPQEKFVETDSVVYHKLNSIPGIEGELFLELPDLSTFLPTSNTSNSNPSLECSSAAAETSLSRKDGQEVVGEKSSCRFQKSFSTTTLMCNKRIRQEATTTTTTQQQQPQQQQIPPLNVKQENEEPKNDLISSPPINKRSKLGIRDDNCNVRNVFDLSSLPNAVGYCNLTHSECERLSNYFEMFNLVNNFWLPQMKFLFTNNNLFTLVDDSKQLVAQFIHQVFLSGSIAFQHINACLNQTPLQQQLREAISVKNEYYAQQFCARGGGLTATSAASDQSHPGKVIFPYIYVLLVLPCVDIFYKRVTNLEKQRQQQNHLQKQEQRQQGGEDECFITALKFSSLFFDDKFCEVIELFKDMHLTQCEYAVLLHYLPVRAFSTKVREMAATATMGMSVAAASIGGGGERSRGSSGFGDSIDAELFSSSQCSKDSFKSEVFEEFDCGGYGVAALDNNNIGSNGSDYSESGINSSTNTNNHRNGSSCSLKIISTISAELNHLNNIIISICGAYSHLNYFETVETVLGSIQNSSNVICFPGSVSVSSPSPSNSLSPVSSSSSSSPPSASSYNHPNNPCFNFDDQCTAANLYYN